MPPRLPRVPSHPGSRLTRGAARPRQVVDNGGLHGDVERCGRKTLAAGTHSAQVDFFQAGGGVSIRATWRGPDTHGSTWLLRSEDAATPPPPPESKWTMRMYASRAGLSAMPDVAFCKAVGTVSDLPFVDFSSLADFRKYVKATPDANYAGEFFGAVNVRRGGTYTFCTASDDGSTLRVDGRLVVDNGGLHGVIERCGDRALAAGPHRVTVDFFQGGGGVGLRVTWRGPDTGYAPWLLRSDADVEARVALPPSRWEMTVYRSPVEITSMPSLAQLPVAGTGAPPSLNFHSPADFRQYVPATPDDRFAVVCEGRVTVRGAGNYRFCTTSDDGSDLAVDGARVVDNSGLHGDVRRCGDAALAAGAHTVRVGFFQNGGGASLVVTWQGPDTDNIEWLLRSEPKK